MKGPFITAMKDMSKTIAVFGSPFKPREYMLIISNATFPPKECPTTVSIVM